MIKKSKQREAILKYLESRKDHPTAEQVYTAVRDEIPNISLGTVYRNLSLLSEMNEICRVTCEEDGSDHFDFDTSPHQHFFCKECGAVVDVPLKNDDSILRMVETALGVSIDTQKTIYYGKCGDCRSREDAAALISAK